MKQLPNLLVHQHLSLSLFKFRPQSLELLYLGQRAELIHLIMDVFKSLQIKNVQTSQEIEEIQNVILMIIKDENPDYLYNPDDKLLVFP